MNKHPVTVALICLLLMQTGACSKTPEQAKEKLAELKVPATPETLLEKTKNAKDEDTAVLIVEAGVDPNARQRNGMTALMSAAFNRQQDVAGALLEKGADANLDAAGFNALSLAVENDDKEMIKLLMKHGADPRKRPAGGLSALEKAQQRQNESLVELLGGESQ